jgi:hypothetical protein
MKGDDIKKQPLELHQDLGEDVLLQWSAVYTLTEHWQADMKFFNDELNFLNILVDKYLLKLAEEGHISTIAPLAMALTKLEVNNRELDQKIEKHKLHIQEVIENPFSHNSQAVKDEHIALESELYDFVDIFRITKKEIFDSTEQILKSEKAKHLLTS